MQTSDEPLCLEDLKMVEVGILKAFDAYCKKHELTYWLGYGTLLGAVRHKGFIPWDDDIDLLMPYGDYRKMIDLANSGQVMGDHYRIATPEIEGSPSFHCPFGKIYDTRTCVRQDEVLDNLAASEGVWVDIFPLVGLPENASEARNLQEHFYRLYAKSRLASCHFRKGNSFLGTVGRVVSLFPARLKGCRFYLDAIDSASRKAPSFHKAESVIAPVEPSRVFNRDNFKDTVYLEFEGGTFPVPAGWDALLTEGYGDYMQLPPQEKRVSNHSFKAVWQSAR